MGGFGVPFIAPVLLTGAVFRRALLTPVLQPAVAALKPEAETGV